MTSELLGHVKGSFTGASAERAGKFQSADGGTLFLDEVESLPKTAQDFLIDTLEGSGNFAPYGAAGSSAPRKPAFRLISASKKPLEEAELRQDLCQRLAAGDVILLPTIEERRDDIPRLVRAFVSAIESEHQLHVEMADEAVKVLQGASWRGQIRELESTVKVVVTRQVAQREVAGSNARTFVITAEHFRAYLKDRTKAFGARRTERTTLDNMPVIQVPPARKRPVDLTREDIAAALKANQGNKMRTAKDLGVALNTLKAKMKAFQLP